MLAQIIKVLSGHQASTFCHETGSTWCQPFPVNFSVSFWSQNIKIMLCWFYCSGKLNFSFVLHFTNRCRYENWHFLHASYIENKVKSSEKTDGTMLNTPWAVLVIFNFSQKFIMPCFYRTLHIVFPRNPNKNGKAHQMLLAPRVLCSVQNFSQFKKTEWATYWQITNFEYRIIELFCTIQ